MTPARKMLTLVDEIDVFVPPQIRDAVEIEEAGGVSAEGDAVSLLLLLARTRPALSERLRIIASTPTR